MHSIEEAILTGMSGSLGVSKNEWLNLDESDCGKKVIDFQTHSKKRPNNQLVIEPLTRNCRASHNYCS